MFSSSFLDDKYPGTFGIRLFNICLYFLLLRIEFHYTDRLVRESQLAKDLLAADKQNVAQVGQELVLKLSM